MRDAKNNQDLVEIGMRLQQIRGTRSKTEFAAMLDIHPNSLSNYENGHRAVDATILLTLAEKFQVSPSWLVIGAKDDGEESYQQAIEKIKEVINTLG